MCDVNVTERSKRTFFLLKYQSSVHHFNSTSQAKVHISFSYPLYLCNDNFERKRLASVFLNYFLNYRVFNSHFSNTEDKIIEEFWRWPPFDVLFFFFSFVLFLLTLPVPAHTQFYSSIEEDEEKRNEILHMTSLNRWNLTLKDRYKPLYFNRNARHISPNIYFQE
jgi:hypothetical protein